MHSATDVDYRIAVVGNSSSGKTTISRYLKEKTNLPYHSIDAISWNPDGSLVSEALRREKHQSFSSGAQWIIDGNSNQSLKRATHVIYLKTGRPKCSVRCVFRAIALKLRLKKDFIPSPIARLVSNLHFIWGFPKFFGNELDKMAENDDRFIVLTQNSDIAQVNDSIGI